MAKTEQEKKLLELKSSFDMFEATIEETIERMKNKLDDEGLRLYTDDDINNQVELLRTAEQEVIDKYVQNGGNAEDLKKKKKRITKKAEKAITELLKEQEDKPIKINKVDDEPIKSPSTSTFIERKEVYQSNEAFDVIPLPSNGECYPSKNSRVSVSYLTAWDENVITAPNLYNDNSVLDVILSRKLKDKNIDPDLLLEGDREAIILFLRATGYGNEYPVNAIDDKTGVEFEAIVDLSKLKYKEFNLKGDENGWFDFTLPASKDKVKFAFLTHKDIKNLAKLEEIEQNKLVKDKLTKYVEDMDMFIENDKNIENVDKVKVRQSIREIEKWEEKIPEEDALQFTHLISNRLELSIMAINGNTDRKFIHDYVKNMRVFDSSALRKYIVKNEPGVDYTIEVERPESLGGGSLKTFLQFDQYVFLNLPE